MLADLSIWIRIPLLMICGAIIGAFINWAIYQWTEFLKRPISPWRKPAEGESPRKKLDYVPIIGWLDRKRDSEVYGKLFWLRPMLIEITWVVGLPWFYYWQASGGLTGGNPLTIPVLYETWFYVHTVLLALLFIGTFIDFDEQTIPDQVTVTGTLFALLVAPFAPWFRLPELVRGTAATVAPIAPIHYGSSASILPPEFHHGIWGLMIAIAIYVIWIWALLPKLPVWYVGVKKTCRFMVAYAIQSKRKTKCEIRTRPRSLPRITAVLGILLVVGLIATPLAWMKFQGTEAWTSLFGSFLGLAFGGGLIWAIRIIGTYALQKEAMGFGDVTLMAMIGAFLGWQSALLAFVMAPFFALLILAARFVTASKGELAFGPYLCGGAVIVLFTWFSLWQKASIGIFMLGPILLYILAGSLVLMFVMLLALQWVKDMMYGDEEMEQG